MQVIKMIMRYPQRILSPIFGRMASDRLFNVMLLDFETSVGPIPGCLCAAVSFIFGLVVHKAACLDE